MAFKLRWPFNLLSYLLQFLGRSGFSAFRFPPRIERREVIIERHHLDWPKNQATEYLIMSDSHSPARAGAGAPFALRALVPISVGPTTINLYPVINHGMPPHKQAHTFHINVTSLSSQSINLQAQRNALDHQLNLSETVDGGIQDWLCHFYDC